MRRSLRLVAACVWLLDLGACADEPAPRTPAALKFAPQPEISQVSLGSAAPAPSLSPTPQIYGASARAQEARPQGDQQLRERFAHARSLATHSGSASYYADKFTGRSTASGAKYDPRGFTAAHRALPFGTVLRVTRVDGGQVVYVRVTDRGPFGSRGRILDLSRAAAERLGMLRAGVVKVKAEVVEYGPPRKKRRRRH